MPQLLKPAQLEPVLRNMRSHHNEKPAHHHEDPTQPKINKLSLLKKKRNPTRLLTAIYVAVINRHTVLSGPYAIEIDIDLLSFKLSNR